MVAKLRLKFGEIIGQSISIDIVVLNWMPLSLLIIGGILWNLFCVMFLARLVFKDAWFERAIAEMGQSMGVTATGLLLLRTVDPDSKTAATSAFASKQLLHEPFMGGGLWTGLAIPLLAGPAAITSVIVSASSIKENYFTTILYDIISLFLVLLITLVMFLITIKYEKFINTKFLQVFSRIIGILLCALSIQFIPDGIFIYFNTLN